MSLLWNLNFSHDASAALSAPPLSSLRRVVIVSSVVLKQTNSFNSSTEVKHGKQAIKRKLETQLWKRNACFFSGFWVVRLSKFLMSMCVLLGHCFCVCQSSRWKSYCVWVCVCVRENAGCTTKKEFCNSSWTRSKMRCCERRWKRNLDEIVGGGSSGNDRNTGRMNRFVVFLWCVFEGGHVARLHTHTHTRIYLAT